MKGNAWHNGLKGARRACARHWVWSSLAVLLILVGAIVCTGLTWSHLGVLAQFLVAVIALGGYIFSYKLYREQEEHKYKVAVVAKFPVPEEEKRYKGGVWIPGFVRRDYAGREALDAKFVLHNIGEAPVTDVRMNWYLHDYGNMDQEPARPVNIFVEDVMLVDGIAKGARVHFSETLRVHHKSSEPENVRALRFADVFSWRIPNETRDEPAHLSAWSLVLKYKNLQGESFFSAYKLEGAVESVESLQPEEYFRMVFFGSFSGDYLKDDEHHQFIANRGFRNAETAPDWDGVRATIEEAARMVANFRSGIEAEAQGKSSGWSAR